MHSVITWAVFAWAALQLGSTVQRAADVRAFSCAAFPADLSEAALVARYGRDNVTRASVWGADDGPQDGAVVFADSSAKLEAVWWDSDARTRLAWVRAREVDGPWATPDGITIGTDLHGIELRNAAPFRLAGLGGPEGRGVIRSWGRGRLAPVVVENCRLVISLQPVTANQTNQALLGQVMRGGNFSSGHPAMQTINPHVVALSVMHASKHVRP